MRSTAWILILLAATGCVGARRPERALILAAREGDLAAITALVRSGADANERGGVNDWTALMHAIHKNQRRSVLALLDAGADVNARSDHGGYETALIMAAGYGYEDIVRDLLERGADPYAETSGGETALSAAVGGVPDIDRFTVCSCQTGTVRALLERAPDLKVKSKLAVWFARLGNCKEVLNLLERQKAAKN